jgi:hypothetical protein
MTTIVVTATIASVQQLNSGITGVGVGVGLGLGVGVGNGDDVNTAVMDPGPPMFAVVDGEFMSANVMEVVFVVHCENW